MEDLAGHWDHQVRHQAVRWTRAGNRGVPLTPDEQVAASMPSVVTGIRPLVEGNQPPAARTPTRTASPDKRKRKREAQKNRKQKAIQELAWLRSNSTPPPAQRATMDKGAKGLGKAHSKNKSKDETCGNWNLKISACSAEGPCRYGRMHKCSRCGGGHRLVDCKTSSEG